jgi:hypothetical protein
MKNILDINAMPAVLLQPSLENKEITISFDSNTYYIYKFHEPQELEKPINPFFTFP